MAETVPPLVLRSEKAAALTNSEGDGNFRILRDGLNAAFAKFGVVLQTNGTLKDNTVATAAVQDRAITQAKLAFGHHFYAVDAGSVNLVQLAFTPYPTEYTTGMMISFKAAVTNTGPVTVKLYSDASTLMAGKDIRKLYNIGLDPGDIKANEIYTIIYDGTNFQIANTFAEPDVPYFSTATFTTDLPTSTGIYTVAHGLVDANGASVVPTHVNACLKCTTADKGFSVGDRIDIANLINAGDAFCAFQLSKTSTQVKLSCRTTGGIKANNPSDTYTYGTLTTASWDIEITASYFAP